MNLKRSFWRCSNHKYHNKKNYGSHFKLLFVCFMIHSTSVTQNPANSISRMKLKKMKKKNNHSGLVILVVHAVWDVKCQDLFIFYQSDDDAQHVIIWIDFENCTLDLWNIIIIVIAFSECVCSAVCNLSRHLNWK